MAGKQETLGFKVRCLTYVDFRSRELMCLPCVQFNHTMLRIKDPKASIKFYTEVCLRGYAQHVGYSSVFDDRPWA